MMSYLALAAHWISLEAPSGRLSLRAALISFHCLKKNHTGVNIARTILHIVDRTDVTHKVCDSNDIYSLVLLTIP